MRKIIFITVLLLSTTVLFAQTQTKTQKRGPYQTNRFFDNVFFGFAGGVNAYDGDNTKIADMNLGGAMDVYVGKWLTPSTGVRLNYSGITTDTKTTGDGENLNFTQLRTDFMWNISNAIGGFKEKRFWNFTPFLGLGWIRGYYDKVEHMNLGGLPFTPDNSTEDEFSATIGMLNILRLGKAVDLTLEYKHTFVGDDFDRVAHVGKGWESMGSLTMGLAFKFNRRGFSRVEPAEKCDYVPYQNKIRDLESDAEALRRQLDEQAKALAAANAKKPTVEVVNSESVTAAPCALFFQLGKATLDSKELTNLDFFVKNSLSNIKNKKFTLTGMADSATGTAEANQKLSEKRMQYVFDILVNKYGVDPNRLIKNAVGSKSDRFTEAALNRCVIIE